MRKIVCPCVLLLIAGLTSTAAGQEKKLDDKVKDRLAEILAPARQVPRALGKPAKLAVPAALEGKFVPPPLYVGPPPQPTAAATKPVLPRLSPEPAPFADDRSTPAPPQEIAFPTRPLLVVPDRVDVHQPVAVPVLATPIVDRAALTDPTLDASIAAALATPIPFRNDPVAFVPMNLPDPFEFRLTLKLTDAPPESDIPQATPPRILPTPMPK